MKISLIRRLAGRISRHRKWAKAAADILSMRREASGGGLLTKGLAYYYMASAVAEAISPSRSSWSMLTSSGYRPMRTSIGAFLCDLLSHSDLSSQTVPMDERSFAVLWEDGGGGIAATYRNGEFDDGPYLRGGDRQYLSDVLRKIVWHNGSDQMISCKETRFSWYTERMFSLSPIPEPGPYVGKPSPEDIASRMSHYGHQPRTLLLRGPSGVGKSVFARRVARAAINGGKTLKISGSVLRSVAFNEVVDLIVMLQPTVLLLDDLRLDDPLKTEDFLVLLESLRVPGSLVIITMMDDNIELSKGKPGDCYFTGMRPGRVDEVVVIPRPATAVRREIFDYYFLEHGLKISPQIRNSLIRMTGGLTGAYIGELVRRLSAHGMKDWRGEVKTIMRLAPVSSGEKKSDAGPPAGGGKCDPKR